MRIASFSTEVLYLWWKPGIPLKAPAWRDFPTKMLCRLDLGRSLLSGLRRNSLSCPCEAFDHLTSSGSVLIGGNFNLGEHRSTRLLLVGRPSSCYRSTSRRYWRTARNISGRFIYRFGLQKHIIKMQVSRHSDHLASDVQIRIKPPFRSLGLWLAFDDGCTLKRLLYNVAFVLLAPLVLIPRLTSILTSFL